MPCSHLRSVTMLAVLPLEDCASSPNPWSSTYGDVLPAIWNRSCAFGCGPDRW